jgi:hypothetical protein
VDNNKNRLAHFKWSVFFASLLSKAKSTGVQFLTFSQFASVLGLYQTLFETAARTLLTYDTLFKAIHFSKLKHAFKFSYTSKHTCREESAHARLCLALSK